MLGGAMMVLALAGCPTKIQLRGEGDGPLLWVQVQSLDAGGLHPLRTGQPLPAGERFGLLIESAEPRFLQLALIAPDDPTPTLWPPEEQAPPFLPAGRPLNIPGSTQWFRAEPRAGHGALVLVLSPRPLPPQELSARVHEAGRPPLRQGPLQQAAAAKQRDASEWQAFTLPPDAAVIRVPLPQR